MRYLYICVVLFLQFQLDFSQTKYLTDDERGVGVNVGYSYLNKTDNYSLAVGVARKNRIGFGFQYGHASAENLVGGFLEWNFIRPVKKFPFGIVTGISFSKSWVTEKVPPNYSNNMRGYNSVKFSILAVHYSIEGYLMTKVNEKFYMYPTFAFSRSFPSISPKDYFIVEPVNSIVYTHEFVFKTENNKILIFSPSYLVIENDKSFGASLSIISVY